jgi:hypothetical protein
LKYLDEFTPNWRDMENGNPFDYAITGDILTVSPAPETALTDGFWFYYAKQVTPMIQDEDYPFSGSTSEFTHLSIFDMAIVLYAKKTIEQILNKDADANLSLQEYVREREEKFMLFKRRKDISSSSDVRFRGPAIR